MAIDREAICADKGNKVMRGLVHAAWRFQRRDQSDGGMRIVGFEVLLCQSTSPCIVPCRRGLRRDWRERGV